MRPFATTTVATYCLLALAGGVSFMLPDDLSVGTSQAKPLTPDPPPDAVRITGKVRDFHRDNTNFNVAPSGGNGHYAGNVSWALGTNDRPVYSGTGYKVATQWRDHDAHPIAPHLYLNGVGKASTLPVGQASPWDGSNVVNTYDSSAGPYGPGNMGGAPTVVVGAPMPTIAVPTSLENLANSGNISYSGTSTISSDLHCNALALSGTVTISGHVRILTEGVASMATNTIVNLAPNSTLRLYALGGISDWNHVLLNSNTHDPSRLTIYNGGTSTYMIHNHAEVHATIISPNAMMELNNHGTLYGRFIGKKVIFSNHGDFHVDRGQGYDACANPIQDTQGVAGASSNGGLVNADRFGEWYVDTMGINASMSHEIELLRSSDDVFEYLDDSFHPVDNVLFGNEGESHNNYFTFSFSVAFTHRACDGRFFQFQGCDDAWMFVDGQLAMDLGGVIPGTGQYVDADRLGLHDGQTYTLHFFYAQRNPTLSVFRVRTNLDFNITPAPQVVSGGFD